MKCPLHPQYELTPFCGTNRDNIYTGQSATKPNLLVSPASATDSVLLPID